MPTLTEQTLVNALSAQALSLRGSFAAVATDSLPVLPDGQPAAVVSMVGVIGSAFWPHFKASAFFNDGQPDPLDRWSRSIGEELAARFGGVALFPFSGPPYHPFQRWADRAEATQASRMMLRIHPDYGLWHAYRFALALPEPFIAPPQRSACHIPAPHDAAQAGISDCSAEPLALAGAAALSSPVLDLCATCKGQPCLQACPVSAYTGETFLLDACATHLHSATGRDCMQSGCLARRACPVGQTYRYTPEHAAFHMRAFADRH